MVVMKKLKFQSTKTYCHNIGLSCCFRQWRAKSHCSYLHGYALEVKFVFEAKHLDETNWVVDFGGLKAVKGYLEANFDHKTLVAYDDPFLPMFVLMDNSNIIDLVKVEATGCEKFAEKIYYDVSEIVSAQYSHVQLISVEVREHGGNSAIVSV